MKLEDKHCREVAKGTPSLSDAQLALMLPDVAGWTVERAPEGPARLRRQFQFKDFLGAMGFVSRLALIAEREQHHPDFAVHYNRVEVMSWTHTVGGISENDFILAAKLNTLEL
jgi:4a-hydroxytetrahydrobiopterin dehydratase